MKTQLPEKIDGLNMFGGNQITNNAVNQLITYLAELTTVVEGKQTGATIIANQYQEIPKYDGNAVSMNTNTVEERIMLCVKQRANSHSFDEMEATENAIRGIIREVTQHHQAELAEVIKEAIRLSDEAERGYETEFNEWRAFKFFRNGLRDYAQSRGIDISDKTETNETTSAFCRYRSV